MSDHEKGELENLPKHHQDKEKSRFERSQPIPPLEEIEAWEPPVKQAAETADRPSLEDIKKRDARLKELEEITGKTQLTDRYNKGE